MDGVLVNSEPIAFTAYGSLFKALNIVVPNDVSATFIGSSDKNNMQKLKDLYKLEHTHEQLIDEKRKHYYEVFDAAVDMELMPGVKVLIENLHENGMKLILASSATKLKIGKIFTRFNLYPYFDEVISGDDFEFSKPHPAIFLEAVAKSGFTADECIVIEDSTNGIKAATAAGVYCIGYKNDEHSLQDTSLANEVITDFKQLSYDKIRDIK